MQEQGQEEEEAARLILGANGWNIFWKVPPCPISSGGFSMESSFVTPGPWVSSARCPWFSGHIRGLTNTMPLHVEILYNEYNFTAAFAVASLLAFLALLTLAAKAFVEVKTDGRKEALPPVF